MPQTVYPWTPSWYRNLQLFAGFADAVSLLCDITPEQHKYMLGRRAMRIGASPLQDVIVEHGGVLADLLDWTQAGVQKHNECIRVPLELIIETRDLSAHKDTWIKHVTTAHQGKALAELKGLVDALLREIEEKRKKFDAEDTGGYSSYSDYSEDETDSELEDDEPVEDNDEEDEERGAEERRRQANDDVRDNNKRPKKR